MPPAATPTRKESRLGDIKETASDAVEIIRELRTPEVQQTLDKVKNLMDTAKGIMAELKSPEWVQNIENFRMISQNIDSTSGRIQSMTNDIKSMPLVSDASSLVRAARTRLESSGNGEGDGAANSEFRETMSAVREMLQSLKELADELRITVSTSKSSGIIQDLRKTSAEVSSTMRTIRAGQESE